MKFNLNMTVGLLLGALLTWAGSLLLKPTDAPTQTASEAEPLYWVAPMDPDYQRDAPGKSPMGMELVPVYADGAASNKQTIRIDPVVVNNLGVRTAQVQTSRWQAEIRTVGYVTYDEDRLLHIHPRVAGWVETLYVKAEGDPVTEGQALYALYSPELVNAQEELVLALKRNNQGLVQAAKDRLRALQMSDGFIDRLQRSKLVTQTVTFHASRDGVVDNLAIRQGFYVQPGTTMMSIGTLDEVWVEAEVFERQAASVRAGLPVVMTTEFLPRARWQGSVDYVYPTLDETTRTLRLRLRFSNEDALLKPNMFAQVVIDTSGDEQVLTVPREAVIRTANQDRVVMALGDGHFKSVAVQLGRVGEHQAEIVSGLEMGDEIVTSAQFLLDSESSKSSDFKRMSHEGMNHD
ncbi:MAG: efflux RND transporter periplasmic adaptor subunit [Marinobacter sp.]|uniref:efflux RND transporter periplasmic adaptor subunit n=1 Tax=Marinobacter sp. TaxID=50741 RepID=UPI003296953D